MASLWYRQTEREDEGPFSFEELVRQVRARQLGADDFVRRAEQPDWQRVDQVVGLLRAARTAPAVKTPAAPPAKRQPAVGDVSPPPSRLRTPLTPSQIKRRGIPAAIAAVILAVGVSWWLVRPRALPRVASARMELAIPSRLEQMRPASPAAPTVAGLAASQPVAVPGIEKVAWLSAPTLSNDMLTLVFVSVGTPETSDDLFLAERSSISEPFSVPMHIKACASPQKEAYPALSFDGLELIFTELGSPSRLMQSRRPGRGQKFGASRPLAIAGDQLAGLNIDGPQFLGPHRIRFVATDSGITQRTQWIAERAAPDEPFRVVDKLPIANPWPRLFVLDGGRRAYYATDEGFFLTVADYKSGEFVTPEKLLTASILGPVGMFDSPIWVAPAEDIIVYCSPGRETPDSPDHRLWMINAGGARQQ